jgi:MFS family permease
MTDTVGSNSIRYLSALQCSDDDERDNLHSSSRSSGDGSYNDTTALMMGIKEDGLSSDYTVPTSNLRRYMSDRFGIDNLSRTEHVVSFSPPTDLTLANASEADQMRRKEANNMGSRFESSANELHTNQPTAATTQIPPKEGEQQRRRIFTAATQRKYYNHHHDKLYQHLQLPLEEEKIILSLWNGNIPPQHQSSGSTLSRSSSSSSSSSRIPLYTALANGIWAPIETDATPAPKTISLSSSFEFPASDSPSSYTSQPMSLMPMPKSTTSTKQTEATRCWWTWCPMRGSILSSSSLRRQKQPHRSSQCHDNNSNKQSKKRLNIHSNDQSTSNIIQQHTAQPDTRHAQALVLGWAFAAIWSGCNVTAPNLTSMANTFGFLTDASRDWYLGSVLAIVQTIASLPIAAAVGLLTDILPSRKKLFVAILVVGALSSALGAISTSSYRLLVLSRWLSGGCMAGSVPVAFSLLSDWFDATERNTASSGLTALMGLGIVGGQVYAGIATTSSTSYNHDWTNAFVASATVQVLFAILCVYFVHDPIRGGREVALQALMKQHGNAAYDRPLTWSALRHALWNNTSNTILLWQGFFSSIPWGVMFVFLNDFLSQERGFTVTDATFLVAVFGIGCAAGGIIGGYVGQIIMQRYDRSYLPLFMAVTTMAGIVPFVWLLNSTFSNARGIQGIALAGMGGLIASLPSVLVRPCILNVNPPESRGAAMTTANLLVQLGRGLGPSCITLIQTIGSYFFTHPDIFGIPSVATTAVRVDRKFAFNVTLTVFWIISALQLLFLMKTLPRDQDAMESDLAAYATQKSIALSRPVSDQELSSPKPSFSYNENSGSSADNISTSSNESVLPLLVTMQERMNSFDNIAAQQTIQYVRAGMQEIQFSPFHCKDARSSSPSSNEENDEINTWKLDHSIDAPAHVRRALWYDQDSSIPSVNNDSAISSNFVGIDNPSWTDDTLLLHPQLLSLGTRDEQHLGQQSTEVTPLLVRERGG